MLKIARIFRIDGNMWISATIFVARVRINRIPCSAIELIRIIQSLHCWISGAACLVSGLFQLFQIHLFVVILAAKYIIVIKGHFSNAQQRIVRLSLENKTDSGSFFHSLAEFGVRFSVCLLGVFVQIRVIV